jgi:hypothetical protein
MDRSRFYGMLAGYEDQNDHDTLRADPVFKIVDRSPEENDLASQPTLSRVENAISIQSLKRLRWFIAELLPPLTPPADTIPPTSQPDEAALPADQTCGPVEALMGAARQRHLRLRRQRDPLGEGQPCTWRLHLAGSLAARGLNYPG